MKRQGDTHTYSQSCLGEKSDRPENEHYLTTSLIILYIIKSVYNQQKKNTYQWNSVESKKRSHIYGQNIYNKYTKVI